VSKNDYLCRLNVVTDGALSCNIQPQFQVQNDLPDIQTSKMVIEWEFDVSVKLSTIQHNELK
jgi:hypothetical protein